MRIATLVLSGMAVLAAQSAPLPDPEAFFAATKDNLAKADRVQQRYAYKERRTELHTNPFGKLGTGVVRVQEVTPVAGTPGVYHRLLLERDGKPVVDAKPERFERRRRTQGRSNIEEAASVLDFAIDRRERIDGRDVIVVSFKAKPGARPQTREARLATMLTGTVWVDEAAREVMRAEATAMDDVSYGLGVIARLRKGATFALTRAPVDGDVWQPTTLRFTGEGRAIVFRKLTVNHVIEWFGYRAVGS